MLTVPLVGGIEIGTGENDHGGVGPFFAEDAEKGFVSCQKKLGGGSVVIVIVDENGRVYLGDLLGQRDVTHRVARKTQVENVSVTPFGEKTPVVVSGAGGASALGDGGTVKQYGSLVFIGRRRADIGVFRQSDE